MDDLLPGSPLPRLALLLLLEVVLQALCIAFLGLERLGDERVLRHGLAPLRLAHRLCRAPLLRLLQLALHLELALHGGVPRAAPPAALERDSDGAARARRRRACRRARLDAREARHGARRLPALAALLGRRLCLRLVVLATRLVLAVVIKVRVDDVLLVVARLKVDVVVRLCKHLVRIDALLEELAHAVARLGPPRAPADERVVVHVEKITTVLLQVVE